MESPYRFIMSPSKSAPDVSVSSLVDRFNTLEVKDRDEEKSAKAIKRLESALRRAEMAREEAETEAKNLRAEMKDDEERDADRADMRGRLEEYEKKYEKAKDRFRQQRVKHEESMRKAAKEFMEREKQHWRQTAAVEEELEWERKVRADAHDLVAFLEVERSLLMQSARARPRQSQREKRVSAVPVPEKMVVAEEKIAVVSAEEQTITSEEAEEPVAESMEDITHEEPVQQEPTQEEPVQQEPAAEEPIEEEAAQGEPQADAQPEQSAPPPPEEEEASPPATEPQPVSALEPSQPSPAPLEKTNTPQKPKPTLIPINFNDDSPSSDKENARPPSSYLSTPSKPLRSSSLRTPSRQISVPNILDAPNTAPNAGTAATPSSGDFSALLGKGEVIDRAAALAAIQYRRGRAKSFVGGASAQMTPKRRELLEAARRDVSAPPLVTMSVGKNVRC